LISAQTSPSSKDRNASPTQAMIQTVTGAMLRTGSWLPNTPATMTMSSMATASARTAATSAPARRPLGCHSISVPVCSCTPRMNRAKPTKDNATVAPAAQM
jgi:hypothetical protein